MYIYGYAGYALTSLSSPFWVQLKTPLFCHKFWKRNFRKLATLKKNDLLDLMTPYAVTHLIIWFQNSSFLTQNIFEPFSRLQFNTKCGRGVWSGWSLQFSAQIQLLLMKRKKKVMFKCLHFQGNLKILVIFCYCFSDLAIFNVVKFKVRT